MKGLLFKEFTLAKKSLLLIFAVSMVLPIALISSIIIENEDVEYTQKILPFVSGYLFVFVSFANPEFFRYDEKPTWCSFVLSSPHTAKGHIQSKYCFMLIINMFLLLICFFTDCIAVAIVGTTQISSLSLYVIIFCLQMIINAVEIPFYIRFGHSKGGNVKASVLGIAFLAAAIYALFGDISFLLGDDPLGDIYNYFTSGKTIWFSALVPYIFAVMYFLSYKISLRLYQKGVESYER